MCCTTRSLSRIRLLGSESVRANECIFIRPGLSRTYSIRQGNSERRAWHALPPNRANCHASHGFRACSTVNSGFKLAPTRLRVVIPRSPASQRSPLLVQARLSGGGQNEETKRMCLYPKGLPTRDMQWDYFMPRYLSVGSLLWG